MVLGGGSAGFNGARAAAELGQRVAIIDGAQELGGLCILRGCMPSKTLLYAMEVLHLAQHGSAFGLRIPEATADARAVQERKRRIIAEFAEYRQRAMESGRFTVFRAHAHFIDPHTVELSDGTHVRGRRFLIATGSRAAVPPVPGLAETPFWTSDEVLNLDFVPESVLVLGGGIVACELAQFLRRLGSHVVLIQRSPNILRDHSEEASQVVQQALRDEGVDLFTSTRIDRVSGDGSSVTVRFDNQGQCVERTGQYLFNALGREPWVEPLHLAAAKVRCTTGGRVAVNRWQQTSQPHIYAGGDVCGPYDVVHLAVAQGELAARHAFGVPGLKPINYALVLNVVFTDPQLATIGRPEDELRAEEMPYLCATYPFDDHGKSILMEAKRGYVKVLAEPKRGRIIGAEIVGRDAGELIHCFTTPMSMRATVHDMLRAPWYHPTLAEIITYPLEEIVEQLKAGRTDARP